MPRTARFVIPGVAHHVIQRGNRKQDVFFTEADYRMYLSLLREQVEAGHFQVLSYCLMRNHVHLILVPLSEQGLAAIGRVHQRYARYMNKKMDWAGYLWQGRFSSYPMDERYCYEAVRYVELNPVRAGICQHPTHYRWSSSRQRIGKENAHDLRVSATGQLAVENWEQYWQEALGKMEVAQEFMDNERALKPLGLKLAA